MRVKNMRRNDHQITLLFAAVNLIHHPVRRRVLPRVVEDDLDGSLAEKDAVIVLMVKVPAFDFAGTYRELINVGERRRMHAPGRIQDFTQRAAIIRLGHCRADDHAMNQRGHPLAFRRDCLNVLTWPGSPRGFFMLRPKECSILPAMTTGMIKYHGLPAFNEGRPRVTRWLERSCRMRMRSSGPAGQRL